MTQSIRQVTVADLPATAVFLDVREQEEWDAGHIQGATHVPLGEVPARTADLPDAQPLYVMCRVGGRSGRATEYLVEQGYDVVNVDGGMLAWEAAGRPMTTDNGKTPEVH